MRRGRETAGLEKAKTIAGFLRSNHFNAPFLALHIYMTFLQLLHQAAPWF